MVAWNKQNLIGRKFNRLTVIEELEGNKVLCKCECGNEVIADRGNVRSGHTKSCGCYKEEFCKTAPLKHGMSHSSVFRSWAHMLERCTNKNCADYKNYGGRGIAVCDEWQDSTAFIKWALSHGYQEGLTIDRIDVNGNYSPDNCRWATRSEQNKNRRSTILLTYNGKTQCAKDWAQEYGVKYETFLRRLRRGVPIEKALIPA